MQDNTLPILCFDILEMIAYQHHNVFKVLYCTCVRLSKMDKLKMMNLSIKCVDNSITITWMLPNGNIHRGYDLPAVIWHDDGMREWYCNGERHRVPSTKNSSFNVESPGSDDDFPAIIYANNCKIWYQHGLLHRDNLLPAIIYADGSKEWYQFGKRHHDNNLPFI